MSAGVQPDLFATPDDGPDGFRYRPALINADEERELVYAFGPLPFKEFALRYSMTFRTLKRRR